MKPKRNNIFTKHFLGQCKQEFVILALLYIIYIFLCPHKGHESDLWCWSEWTKYIFLYGLPNTYQGWTEYPPGHQYLLYLFGYVEGNVGNIERNIYHIKYFTLIFDFAGALLCLIVFQKNKNDFYKVLLILLNISYIYNTLIWGQVDSIFSFFVFASVIAATKNRVLLSAVLYLVALSFKVQAIIFLPLVFLLLLSKTLGNYKITDYMKLSGVCILTVFLIIFPFLNFYERMVMAMTNSVDRYPVISMNAFNMWHLFFWKKVDLTQMKDTMIFLNLSYKNWGHLLFFISSGIALLPMTIAIYKKLFLHKAILVDIAHILLVGALIPLLFFFFNTQMHERYSYPAFLFIIAYSFLRQRYFLYIIFSFAYFLNLEKALRAFDLPYTAFIFGNRFIAGLYLITIVVLFRELILNSKVSNKTSSLDSIVLH
jgi:Gpi18-like mannosyltransferase